MGLRPAGLFMKLAVLFLALLSVGYADTTYPTPEITRIEPLGAPGARAWVMRGELEGTGHYVGLGIVCREEAPGGVEVTAYFSSFPGKEHPVQLAVRSAGGRGESFGPVVAAGPESGFHSPRLTDPDEAERFLRLALEPGSLVSNGYRSFWNRVSEARNREVLTAFLACVRGN